MPPQSGAPLPAPHRRSAAADTRAPDGSEIRFLAGAAEMATRGSLVEVNLQPGLVTIPIRHRTVEETWHVVGGSGQVWRAPAGGEERTDAVTAGDSLVIPLGCRFQFASGPAGLRFLCFTTPPWPGAAEAVSLEEGGLGPPRLSASSPGS